MKKIIIIGGGIAGLTAGIYAQKAGFESVIYEKHSISGGECTGWDRQGFHIDGCIHWLQGTKAGTGLNKIWKEVGGLENVDVYSPDNFVTAECKGTKIVLHKDLDKLKGHLIEVSPEDKNEIEELCKYIESFYAYELLSDKPVDLMNIFELLKFYKSMGKVSGAIRNLGKLTITEYVQRFKNPAIQEAFKSIIPGDYSAYTLPFSLGTYMSDNGGRPEGGSLAFAKRIEEKYRSLGGKIVLGKEVKEIIVDNGIAKGIVLADDTEDYAEYIVPACDINITFEKLLKGQYRDDKFVKRYEDDVAYPLHSCVLVSFGIDADLSSYPEGYVFETEEYRFEDNKLDMLSLKHYCYEPSFAPDGKSVVVAYFEANYDWWKEKHQNRDDYKAEKTRLAQDIISRMEKQFPELSGKIKTIDVATPMTYERYCGAYKGAWMAFGPTPKGKQLMHDGKIKGIKNIYMAGQWLIPSGGLSMAVTTGKWAIQRICKKEKIK